MVERKLTSNRVCIFMLPVLVSPGIPLLPQLPEILSILCFLNSSLLFPKSPQRIQWLQILPHWFHGIGHMFWLSLFVCLFVFFPAWDKLEASGKGEPHTVETMPSCQVGKSVGHFPDWWLMKGPSPLWVVLPWAGGSGDCVVAGWASPEGKTVRTMPPLPPHQLLTWLPALTFLIVRPGWRHGRQMNSFPPQIAFGIVFYHSNRKDMDTHILNYMVIGLWTYEFVLGTWMLHLNNALFLWFFLYLLNFLLLHSCSLLFFFIPFLSSSLLWYTCRY